MCTERIAWITRSAAAASSPTQSESDPLGPGYSTPTQPETPNFEDLGRPTPHHTRTIKRNITSPSATIKRAAAAATLEISQDPDEDDDMDIDIATSRVCLLPMLTAAVEKHTPTAPEYSQTQDESQLPDPSSDTIPEPEPESPAPICDSPKPIKPEPSPVRPIIPAAVATPSRSWRRERLGERLNDDEGRAPPIRSEKTQESVTDSPLSIPKGFVASSSMTSSYDESQMDTLPLAVREFFAALRDTERP